MSALEVASTIFFGLLLALALALAGYCCYGFGYVRGWRDGQRDVDEAERDGRMRLEARFEP